MKTKSFENIIAKAFDWIIPFYGDNHSIPYGTLLVSGIVNGETKKPIAKRMAINIAIPHHNMLSLKDNVS